MKEMALIAQKLKKTPILGGYDVIRGPKKEFESFFSILDKFFLQILNIFGPRQSVIRL